VVSTLFHSTLHSLGGMQALFPMISQLDLPQAISATTIDYNLSVKLLSLVFEMARNSTSFMLQLVRMKAMELITYHLEKASIYSPCVNCLSKIDVGRDQCSTKFPDP